MTKLGGANENGAADLIKFSRGFTYLIDICW